MPPPPSQRSSVSSKKSSSYGGGARDSGQAAAKSAPARSSGPGGGELSKPSRTAPSSSRASGGVRSIEVGPQRQPVQIKSVNAPKISKPSKSEDANKLIRDLGEKYDLPSSPTPEQWQRYKQQEYAEKNILPSSGSITSYDPSYYDQAKYWLAKNLYGDTAEGLDRINKIENVAGTIATGLALAPGMPSRIGTGIAAPAYNSMTAASSAARAARAEQVYKDLARVERELAPRFDTGAKINVDLNKLPEANIPAVPGEGAYRKAQRAINSATYNMGLGTGRLARARASGVIGAGQVAAFDGVPTAYNEVKKSYYGPGEIRNQEPSVNRGTKGDYQYSGKSDFGYTGGGMKDGGVVSRKDSKVTAPLTYDPGKGRPKEHLAYLNWQEMEALKRLNGGNMERGPRGLPSFPPADAIGSSSRAPSRPSGGSSGSRTYGGGGRDAGGRSTAGYGGSDVGGRGRGPGGGSLSAPSRTAPSVGRGAIDSRGVSVSRIGAEIRTAVKDRMEATRRDLLARDAAEARNARTALTSPSVREDAGKQIAGTISGIAALTNVQQKIQDRVPSYVTRTRVPISEREPPAFVPKGPTYNINAMTTDFGPGFTSGMRSRISQDAFIATGYMPGFVPASKLPLAKVSDQPYGMRTPISPARGQPYGMNISTAVPPREIDAKSPDARRDIDVARLTDRTSFASGVSFRGFPDVSRIAPAQNLSGGINPVSGLPWGQKITDRVPASDAAEGTRMSMTSAAARPEYVQSAGAYARPERAPPLGGIGSVGLPPGYAEKYPSVVAAQTVSRGAYDPANLRAYESLVGPEAYSSIGSEAEKYLASKEADRVAKSDEKVLGVENVPPSPASLQVNTGLSPAEQYFKDIRDVKGVVTKEELASLPEELQKIYMDKQRWERRTDEPYPLTEEQKTAIRAAKIGTSALRKSIIGRAFAGTIRAGAKAVEALAPEGSDLELAARKAAEGGEALMDPGEAMAEYYRADPIEQQRLAEAQRKYREAVGFSWFPESRGERQFVGGGGGMGAVSVSGGGGGADSGGGRPYVYYQWDVGVNIPSPGDPLYTQYQEYLKTKETAPSA